MPPIKVQGNINIRFFRPLLFVLARTRLSDPNCCCRCTNILQSFSSFLLSPANKWHDIQILSKFPRQWTVLTTKLPARSWSGLSIYFCQYSGTRFWVGALSRENYGQSTLSNAILSAISQHQIMSRPKQASSGKDEVPSPS